MSSEQDGFFFLEIMGPQRGNLVDRDLESDRAPPTEEPPESTHGWGRVDYDTFILISHGRVIWRDPTICIIARASCCIKLNRIASKIQQPRFAGNYSLPQNSTYANYPTVTIFYYRHCYCRHYCRRYCRRSGRRDPGSPPPSDKPNRVTRGVVERGG